MTAVTHEVPQGAEINYGGDPPAPTGARERVVQFFDDGSSRTVTRERSLADIFQSWNASIEEQRAAVAQQSAERAVAVTALTEEVDSLTGQLNAVTEELATVRAQYTQLLSEVEPV